MADARLKVTQLRSRNGCDRRQLDTLRSLGLRRIGHTVEVGDTPQIRGMLHKVRHLVAVVEAAGADSKATSPGGEVAGANR
jgi:large subunit ribosomal protein L30